MIYCQKCGTANRDGSRFCNECGASLPHTGRRCPECGTFNPTGTVFCDECGARLIPPAAGAPEEPPEEVPKEEASKAPIKGLSLPTIPLENEGDAPDQTPTEEPDWMSQLRAGIDEEGEGATAAEDSESIDLPDWLGGASGGGQDEEPEGPASPFTPDDEFSVEDAGGMEGPLGPPGGGAEREEEPPSSSPFVVDEEMPDAVEIPEWLSSASSEAEGPSEEVESSEQVGEPEELPPLTGEEDGSEGFEDVEIPEWLRGMGAEESAVPSERDEEPEMSEPPAPFTSGGKPVEDAEIPDWLRDMAPAEEPRPSTPATPSEPEREVEPEPMEPAEPPTPEALEEAPEAAEIPDWLQDMAPAEQAQPPTPEAPSEPEREVEPEPVEPTEPPAPEVSEEAPEAAEVPDWLRQMAPGMGVSAEEPEGAEEQIPPSPAPAEQEVAETPREAEAPETPPPFVGAEELPEGAEIPAWLMEEKEEPAGEAEPQAPVPFAAEEGEPAIEAGELPDWLMEMKPEEGEEPAEPTRPEELPETEPLDFEGLAPAQIPTWLEDMRPSAEEPEEPEGVLETEGLLEGLRGTLQVSSLVEARGAVGAPPSGEPSPVSVARAELLQELVARPATPMRPKERERGEGIWWVIQKMLVSLLILAAVIAPVMGIQLFDSGSALPTNGLSYDAIEVYETLELLVDEGTPVLVAFEYGSSEAEEMDVIASPLMRHLLDRGARVVVVSTQEQGPALAEQLISSAPFTEEQAERVVNLGYQPGWEAGVQDLLADLSDRSVYRSEVPASESTLMEGVTSAQDVGVVLVLAGRSASLRAWVEQITARFPDLPVVAGVSARVEPGSRPYVEATGQLRGIVSGLVGAASYESQLGTGTEWVFFYLNSLTLTHLAVAGLMVVGAIVFLVGGRGE